MERLLRRHLVSIAVLALAGLIGLAAIIDHANKGARMDRAERLEWYCIHKGTHCGGPSSDRIESRWNERQWAYEVAVAALGVGAVARVVLRERRR
jgi:hypothetical protein